MCKIGSKVGMDLEHFLKIHAIHMALDGICFSAEGFLKPLPGSVPDKIQRLYLAQHDNGFLRCFREDLPAHIRRRLSQFHPEQILNDPETIKTLLAEDAPCEEIMRGKSYLFPKTLTPRDFPDVVQLDATYHSQFEQFSPGEVMSPWAVYAVIINGRIVSTCQSSQENTSAAEAWVRTLPDFRKRGYARQVTAAWAYQLQQRGKTPFYSHRWDNIASEAVARSLQLTPYATEVGYF
jgi:hypothetical protein